MQLAVVVTEAEKQHLSLYAAFHHVVKLAELLGVVVAWRYIPVEVILREHVYYVVIGEEGNLFGVERPEERWRQIHVERAGTPYGEYKLHERGVDVFPGAALGLGPQQGFRFG